VIEPNCPNVVQRIYDSREQTEDDPLADFNIPYVQRREDEDVLAELRTSLAGSWLLILGPTGLGKTRVAAELAQAYSAEGWTVMRLQNHELLTVPSRFPADRLERQPRLLFVLDNLNGVMGQDWQVPAEDENGAKAGLMRSPLQMRLLKVLRFYMIHCDVRVVATARNECDLPVNEHVRQIGDVQSEWEKLGIDKYPEFWRCFEQYPLPPLEDEAATEFLAERTQAAGIKTEGSLAEIAATNDRTFRNLVENLRNLRNQQAALTMDSFMPTMGRTWKSQYAAVRKRYGMTAAQLYDGVDLLRQVGVPLRERSVLVAAQMVAGGKWWQRWWQLRKLRQVLKALEKSERILEPRDGQIEAKGYRAELDRYFELLCQRLPTTFEADDLVNSLMGLAFAAYERQNYKIALDFLNRGFQASDTIASQSTLFLLQGNVLSMLGRKEESIATYDRALALNSDHHEALNNKGAVLNDLGRHDEAITAYDAALVVKPDKYETFYNKGNALNDLGRNKEMILAYDAALEIKPDYHKAPYNKGAALNALGRHDDAIAAYDAALAIKPDCHEALSSKGAALSALGRNDDAITAYDAALEIKPDYYEAFYNKGIALSALDRKDDAITAYDAALEIKPSDHKALSDKGVVLSALGRNEEAIEAFNKALSIKPDYYESLTNKGVVLSALGRNEEAISSHDAALAIKPDYPESLTNKGVALSALGRNEEAIAVCDQAIKIKPEYDSAWYNKACFLALTNQSDYALTCLQKAIELEGGTEYIEMAKTDTSFDSIRHDPRFQALITAAA
jgi:tetratricopeptide (TPR) repeat protein